MGLFLRVTGGIGRPMQEASTLTIYDQVYIASGTVTAGTAITLPAAETYTADELEVWLNGQRMKVTDDYNYVGSAPRTQIVFTFDLLNTEQVRFRIDRAP